MDEYLIELYNKGYSIDYITNVYYKYINKQRKNFRVSSRLFCSE